MVVNYAADADGAESVVSTIRAHGGRAVAVRADVTAPDDVAELFDRAVTDDLLPAGLGRPADTATPSSGTTLAGDGDLAQQLHRVRADSGEEGPCC